ncbi:helix-turn-helix domain-containing protein [Streptomyces xiamenensis]|uniref:helix-turn-helix domain-containing protein n=1 Tax=Streptomyces xiamenensis TaxID=408015 RepID=UPI0036E862AE
MSSAPRGVHEARQELGVRLRALREAAGLDGRTLAGRLGWPPSKVSKIQLGRQAPTEGDVRQWTAACDEPHAAEELLILLRDLDRRYADWQQQLRQGHAAVQRAWKDTEAAAQTIRSFESCWVPGLLQTPDYAKARFLEHAANFNGPRDTEAAVAARMDRQKVLYEPGRQKRHIVVSESVVRYGLAPTPVMRAQIDRLVSATTLPSVRLGVIPLGKRLPVSPVHNFCIFDDQLVTVEIVSAELRLGHPEEVALYRKVFDVLAASALYDSDARRLLTAAAESWA